jgi:lysophospholipase L1-like esterase
MPKCLRNFATVVTLVVVAVWSAVSLADGPRGENKGNSLSGRKIVPTPQANEQFLKAHRELLAKARSGKIDVYFVGDSITRRWQATDYPKHRSNWEKNFYGWNAANFGWGGDRTENVLWRLQHGELDDVNPKIVVLMVGTNNISNIEHRREIPAVVDEVVHGIQEILDAIQRRAHDARIILMGITPRSASGGVDLMPAINQINDRLWEIADGERISFLNINDKLLDPGGSLRKGVTTDGLHLSNEGYQIWANALRPIFTKRLGPPASTDEAPAATGIPAG